MRSLLEALFPGTAEPYRLLEHMMNEGLRALAVSLRAGSDPYELLFAEIT